MEQPMRFLRKRPAVANPDLLRQHIDRGKAADKIDQPDPAAAPLGTDDEAAGTPIRPAQLAAALRAESRSNGGPAPAQSGQQDNRRSNLGFAFWLVLVGAGMIALTLVLTR